MNLQSLRRGLDGLDYAADFLQAPFAFATRVFVSWQFLVSGYWKITNWDQTTSLFETVYHVPVLSPWWGAVTGTFGELVFPTLLILGLGGRLPAIGLFFVNIVAVISFTDVLFADDGIAGLRQHELWGFMLAMLIVYGPGAWTLDRWTWRRRETASYAS